MVCFLVAIYSVWMLAACRQRPEFVVTGVVAGAEGQTVYLENVALTAVVRLDSVKLNASGKFTFKKAQTDYPEFYRLRLNNQFINFAIDSTETIAFVADAGTFATSYTVDGSANCTAIKEITLAQLDASQALKQLRKEYAAKRISDSTFRQRTIGIAETYKDVARKHIYAQPMSTAAYFALFQQIDGLLFFDLYDKSDSRMFGAVATSYNHFYPQSPRAKNLYNLALQSLKALRSERGVDLDKMVTQATEHFKIDLPGIMGESIRLSDVAKDKIVLINFTAYQSDWSPMLNLTLGTLYAKYHEKGLEIYQVSLDEDLHLWKNIASNLAWTCVRDPQTVYSQVARNYNVRQLPVIFLIDRNGEIVKRVEEVNTLEKEVQCLFYTSRGVKR
jgi:glutathione peroxidase-family protein